MINTVIEVGRISNDLQLTQAGQTAMCTFNIAVNRIAAKEGQQSADFFQCKVFGKIAQNLVQYCHKGSLIAIRGSLQSSSWDDKTTGQKRYGVSILVNEVHYLDPKPQQGGQQQRQFVQQGGYPQQQQQGFPQQAQQQFVQQGQQGGYNQQQYQQGAQAQTGMPTATSAGPVQTGTPTGPVQGQQQGFQQQDMTPDGFGFPVIDDDSLPF